VHVSFAVENHLPDANLLRPFCQFNSAANPANAPHVTLPHQRLHHFGHVVLRNAIKRRHLARIGPAGISRQVQQRPQGIVGMEGESHKVVKQVLFIPV